MTLSKPFKVDSAWSIELYDIRAQQDGFWCICLGLKCKCRVQTRPHKIYQWGKQT